MIALCMEEGICNIFQVTNSKTVHKCKIEKNIAKVNKGFTNKHDKTKNRFFDTVI